MSTSRPRNRSCRVKALFCSILFWLLLALPASNSAQTNVLDVLKKQDEPQKELPPQPDAVQLAPNFWDFFQADQETFNERVESYRNYLQGLIEASDPSRRKELERTSQRILLNLRALPEARKQKAVELRALPPFENKYSTQQFLQIIDNLRKLEAQFEDTSKELRQFKERAAKAQRHLDQLLVYYLSLKEPSAEKQELGLKILEIRAALAITEENIRYDLEKTEQLKESLKHQKELFNHSRQHLDWAAVNTTQIQQQLSKLKDRYAKIQVQTLLAESAAIGYFGDSQTERSHAALLRQRALLASVKEAIIATELISLEVQSTYAIISRLPPEEQEQKIQEVDLTHLQAELVTFKAQQKEWLQRTEEEYERVIQPITRTDKESAASERELELLHKERNSVVLESFKELKELRVQLLFTEQLLLLLQQKLSNNGDGLTSWLNFFSSTLTSCCDPVVGWFYAPLFKIGQTPITAMSLLRILVIMTAAYAISKLLQRAVQRIASRSRSFQESSIYLLKKLLHYICLLFGFALALVSINLNLNNLFLLLSALTIGISFGLQTIANNFFCGLLLLFSRMLKVGDYVELHTGGWGRVTGINMQNTIIRTYDGIEIIVPNSQMISNKVTNWTLNDNFKRLHLPFLVTFGSDKELVVKAAHEAALKVPCSLLNSPHHEAPGAWFIGYADNGMKFEMIVWVNMYSFAHRGSFLASYYWELDNALQKYGLEVPCPQRRVLVEKQE